MIRRDLKMVPTCWVPIPGELWSLHGEIILVIEVGEKEIQFFDCAAGFHRVVTKSLGHALLKHDPQEIILLAKSNINNQNRVKK